MMTLRLNTHYYGASETFEVSHVEYQLDENNVPIDIILVGTEKVLENICEFAYIGCNMQPLSEWKYASMEAAKWIFEGATHECLIARLPEFTVENASKVIFK